MTSDAAIGGDAGAPDELLQHQVPTVAAVAAAVRSDIPDKPRSILWRWSDEMCGTPAIHADDRVGGGFGSP